MKRAWLWVVLLIVVLAAAGAAWWYFYRSQAAVTGCDGATVYMAADYGGNNACLTVGEYRTADLEAKGIGNDNISSIRVEPNYTIDLYSSNSFSGLHKALTEDIANLQTLPTGESTPGSELTWNDIISSVKVSLTSTPPSCDGVTVYMAADYGGNNACLIVGEYRTADLEAKGIGNDNISSIKVKSGYTIDLYSADGFDGLHVARTEDISNLQTLPTGESTPGSELTWNDIISSVKVTATTTPPPATSTVTLTANGKDAVDIDSGDSVTLAWVLSAGTQSNLCSDTPDGWFTSGLTGTATVTPTEDTTYKLTCGAVSDQVVVNILSAEEDTCTAPLTETRTQTCPTGQTGSITQTRTKGAAPTCAWGDWTTTTTTCTTTVATTTPTTTTTTPSTTTTASTGPETPLIAGGLLSLVFGAFYWLRRKL